MKIIKFFFYGQIILNHNEPGALLSALLFTGGFLGLMADGVMYKYWIFAQDSIIINSACIVLPSTILCAIFLPQEKK